MVVHVSSERQRRTGCVILPFLVSSTFTHEYVILHLGKGMFTHGASKISISIRILEEVGLRLSISRHLAQR